MQSLFLNKKSNTISIIDIDPDKRNDVKKYLECDNWDAPLHRIGQVQYRILVDDNSWPLDDVLNSDELISVMSSQGSPIMYGSLLFFRYDGLKLTELQEEDVKNITKHTVTLPRTGLVVVL